MKKLSPLIFSLFSFIAIIYFWDSIKLPYDENNLITGEYFNKKFNPFNDTLRFLLIIGVPSFVYLLFYLKLNVNTFSLIIYNEDFFLTKKNNYSSNNLSKNLSYIFILIVILEFMSVDFKNYVYNLDIFHQGTYLVPPMNYIKTNQFFQSTLYDYGFVANNLGLFFYKLFNFYTPGSIILINLILFLFIKIFLILIISKLINFFPFRKNLKTIFYILSTFILINLPNYNDLNGYFLPRTFLYIFFIYYLGVQLTKRNNSNLNFIILGFFSFFSILWWWDIGAYTNTLIFFLLIYLFIEKQFRNIFFLFIGISLLWFLFFLLAPSEIIKEFIFQLKIPYSNYWEYLLGIEYLKPFSSHSSRWTKAILMIYFSCLMLINLNFNKEYKLNYDAKIFLNLIFVSSILIFKSALMRSDGFHLKYSSGLYTLIFLCLLLFYIVNYINNNTKLQNYFSFRETNKKITYILTFIFIFTYQLTIAAYDKNFFNNLINILDFKNNIYILTKTDPEKFLSKDTKEVIDFYKNISKDDNCVQLFTDDISFSYFLKKKTCTQYFIPAQIMNGFTEDIFLDQLKKNLPNIVLYESSWKILSNKNNMFKTIEFINNNYSFYKNYKGYIFYKKNI